MCALHNSRSNALCSSPNICRVSACPIGKPTIMPLYALPMNACSHSLSIVLAYLSASEVASMAFQGGYRVHRSLRFEALWMDGGNDAAGWFPNVCRHYAPVSIDKCISASHLFACPAQRCITKQPAPSTLLDCANTHSFSPHPILEQYQ